VVLRVVGERGNHGLVKQEPNVPLSTCSTLAFDVARVIPEGRLYSTDEILQPVD